MPRILIVDDHPDTANVLARLLRRCGYETETAYGGRTALARLAAVPDTFGLVILDLNMPDIDGEEVLRRLRAAPATAAVPVAVYTAMSDTDSRRRAMDAGAMDVWIKAAFDVDELCWRVARLLAV